MRGESPWRSGRRISRPSGRREGWTLPPTYSSEKEGQALLRHIRPTDRVIALCIVADAPDSVGLSKRLTGWSGDGRRNVFVIGGSNGLSDEVLRRADVKLSFSNLTFPHGLMRVILLEQLYRAERIRTGEPYHK